MAMTENGTDLCDACFEAGAYVKAEHHGNYYDDGKPANLDGVNLCGDCFAEETITNVYVTAGAVLIWS